MNWNLSLHSKVSFSNYVTFDCFGAMRETSWISQHYGKWNNPFLQFCFQKICSKINPLQILWYPPTRCVERQGGVGTNLELGRGRQQQAHQDHTPTYDIQVSRNLKLFHMLPTFYNNPIGRALSATRAPQVPLNQVPLGVGKSEIGRKSLIVKATAIGH